MTVTKEELHALIDTMPDRPSIEDVQERLYLLQKIRRSEEAIDRGEGLTPEQAKAKLARWLSE